MQDCGNHPSFSSRREFLNSFAWGMGGLSLASILNFSTHTLEASGALGAKKPHFQPKAKAVIQLFASGAPSHVDTFDYKPELQKRDGEKHDYGNLLASPFEFKRFGKSGVHYSEVWSKLASHADDIAIINSMQTPIPDHGIASKFLHTGSSQLSKPSLGSWLVYGLGTFNENMPGFISLNSSPEARQCAFLPGMYQGCNVAYRQGMNPNEILANLRSEFSTIERQRRQLDLARSLSLDHMSKLQKDTQLEARLESFETAFKMQTEATDAFDTSKESEAVKDLYGRTEEGARMLVARRLVEKGVRMVQVNVGGYDHHSDIKNAMSNTARRYDQAFSALLTDLKQRGLHKDVLVVWGGEFGRTVTSGGGAGAPGRDHNGKAFSVWMSGGGVQGGQRYGETDEIGAKAVKDETGVHDLHATILHLMGFDHTKLIYEYNGRPFRLTDVYGDVIKEITG
jgi:hypothetical protein